MVVDRTGHHSKYKLNDNHNTLKSNDHLNEKRDKTNVNMKGALAIRLVFSPVDMITKTKFSNCLNAFKSGLFR